MNATIASLEAMMLERLFSVSPLRRVHAGLALYHHYHQVARYCWGRLMRSLVFFDCEGDGPRW